MLWLSACSLEHTTVLNDSLCIPRLLDYCLHFMSVCVGLFLRGDLCVTLCAVDVHVCCCLTEFDVITHKFHAVL